jgi:spoIIIJ-associated protein
MKSFVEKTGKTLEEAVVAALDELKITEEEADIQIVDEGKKGWMGLIGTKEAKVRVSPRKGQKTEKSEIEEERARTFLTSIFEGMNLEVDIDTKKEANVLKIELSGEKMGILIGKRGETLDSLQYLTSLVVNKGDNDFVRISLDTENYRKKREQTLIRLANKLADRVIKYRRNMTLEPMNPYERRIIHSTLQKNEMVNTYSIGEEPNRKVVIAITQRKRTDI